MFYNKGLPDSEHHQHPSSDVLKFNLVHSWGLTPTYPGRFTVLECHSIQQVEFSPWVVGHLFTALIMLCPHHPLKSSSSELLLHQVRCMITKAVNFVHPGVSRTLQLCHSRVSLAPSLAILPKVWSRYPCPNPCLWPSLNLESF